MPLFAVRIYGNNPLIKDYVKEINNKLNKDNNPVLIFFRGKVSLINNKKRNYLIFNILISPFDILLIKYFHYWIFRKAIKKLGINNRIELLSNYDFQKLLRCYI